MKLLSPHRRGAAAQFRPLLGRSRIILCSALVICAATALLGAGLGRATASASTLDFFNPIVKSKIPPRTSPAGPMGASPGATMANFWRSSPGQGQGQNATPAWLSQLASQPQVSLSGQVTDLATGQPVARATIQALSFTAQTNAQGFYHLDLPPGTYDVRAVARGYIGMTYTRYSLPDQGGQLNLAMVLERPSPDQDELIYQKLVQMPDMQQLDPITAGSPVDPLVTTVTDLPDSVRVLMTDGSIVRMNMDEYLRGVIPSEMPPNWPMEALKAQAVAARTYAATRRISPDADVDTTTRSQVWQPIHYDTTDQAIRTTHGVAVRYNNNLISALFFASCPGRTKNSEDVFTNYVAYLRGVDCPHQGNGYYGHGVGLCQQGSRDLALQGKNYLDIVHWYYTGVQVNAPTLPGLTQPQVTTGNNNTEFRVTYTSASGDMPVVSDLYLDGKGYALNWLDGIPRTGAVFGISLSVPPGKHTYRFVFDDGYTGPVRTEPAEITVAGQGSGTPQPQVVEVPSKTTSGTQAIQWRLTTRLDFAPGSLGALDLTADEDASLVLSAGQSAGVYTTTVFTAPFTFNAAGLAWQANLPGTGQFTYALRASSDGQTWSSWVAGDQADAQRFITEHGRGELLLLTGKFVQVQITLTGAVAASGNGAQPRLDGLTLTMIDSSAGPVAPGWKDEKNAPAPLSDTAEPRIISRAEWGADESLRFKDNQEIWPLEYRQARVFIIHHSDTPNTNDDPAATVRAIYYYHAVTRQWGDIGYNFLVDRLGNIYQGRFTGMPADGQIVVGGHALQYNYGSVGIVMLGTYSTVAPSTAMENTLVEFIAWRANRYFIDPLASQFFIDKTVQNVSGHRDVISTTCPGDLGYSRLPTVRTAVRNRQNGIPPNIRWLSPPANSKVGGIVELRPQVSVGATQVDFAVDNNALGTATAPFVWDWSTAGVSAGAHTLQVTAHTTGGKTAIAQATLTVDNTPPSGSLSTPAIAAASLALTLNATGASQYQYSLGWRWEGESLYHTTGRQISDASAENGQAWQALSGSDPAGSWYGPYTNLLPPNQGYRAYYRMKVGNASTKNEVALLDVVDNAGTRTYTGHSLRGTSFAGANAYQEPFLDFTLGSPATSGVEFRTAFRRQADLALDRVWVFTAPRSLPAGNPTTLALPAGDGPMQVSVRYLDDAGNPSSIYSSVVLVDQTPPVFLANSTWYAAQVQDVTSGLAANSGEYALSTDGGQNWGSWRPATLNGPDGSTSPQTLVPGDTAGATHVRFRVKDRAGNSTISPAYVLSGDPTPTPTTTQTATATPLPTATPSPTPTATPGNGCDNLVANNLVTNGDFENGLGSEWQVSGGGCLAQRSTFVARGTGSLFMGIPSSGSDTSCDAFAYQTITIPAGSHPPDGNHPQLSFWVWMRSDDVDLSHDRMDLEIQDNTGAVLDTPWRTIQNSRAWFSVGPLDMSPYAGRSVRLYFHLHNDGSGAGKTYAYLDDVSVSSCNVTPTPTPPWHPQPPFSIRINEDGFNPAFITIPISSTLVWINQGNQGHTTTDNGGTWDSGNLAPGQSFSQTLTTIGTYPYRDQHHENLSGSVRVTVPGDFDGNCTVDLLDMVRLANEWGLSAEDPEWDPILDLKPDGHINLFDVMEVSIRWGSYCP
ncbi:MAG: SpoIID/LytB domain-containing protein [Chloroflexi bacterium]|nr:SpoIID/LytB domain-containing protein [Chloroflexota bacterium]